MQNLLDEIGIICGRIKELEGEKLKLGKIICDEFNKLNSVYHANLLNGDKVNFVLDIGTLNYQSFADKNFVMSFETMSNEDFDLQKHIDARVRIIEDSNLIRN